MHPRTCHISASCHSQVFIIRIIFCGTVKYKINVNCTLVQVLRCCTVRTAHRGCRGIALPFHDHGTRRGEGSASRPGRSLPPGKTRYPLYRRLGGPQDLLDRCEKSRPYRDSIPDSPARSQSLYRLRYPVRQLNIRFKYIGTSVELFSLV